MNNVYDITKKSVKFNTLHSDYRTEIIALNLLKYYTEVDQIFLKRLGSNNRSFNKDIESIKSQVYELGELILTIFSHREGLYDYLPESIFHPPSLGNNKSSVDEIIAQIQKQKKIEADARVFFHPFELESFFLELNSLIQENEFEITDRSEMLLNTIKKLWPLLNALDKGTSKIFIYMLPFFHMIRGRKDWLEKCLTALLQIPVRVNFTPNLVNDIKDASDTISLSAFNLGISTVLSGEHMDGERNWAIYYGPIPYSEIARYVPHSNLRKLLRILYDYFLPATIEVEEHFLAEKNKDSFLLDKQRDTSRLGHSTFL